jgi:hypothetical protein
MSNVGVPKYFHRLQELEFRMRRLLLFVFLLPPHPLPLPVGERKGVRGAFKYF